MAKKSRVVNNSNTKAKASKTSAESRDINTVVIDGVPVGKRESVFHPNR